MRRLALVIVFMAGLNAQAFSEKAEIEAVNAKWMEFFNKGDFAGIGSLYTEDATALPPGSAMVKGRAAIEAMWKSMAEQVTDPKVTALDVKSLGPSAARGPTFGDRRAGSEADAAVRQPGRYGRGAEECPHLGGVRSVPARRWAERSRPTCSKNTLKPVR